MIENFDDYMPVDDHKYKNINENIFSWPGRALFIGSSGSGKTNLVLNLVCKYVYADDIYIFAKDLDEDKYRFLIEYCKEVGKKKGNKDGLVKIYSSNLSDLPDLDTLDRKKQHLFIFDDFLVEKNQKPIEDYFVRSRHQNCSIFYMTQSYYDVPKIIRRNFNYAFIFNVSSKKEVIELAKDFAVGVDKDQFYQMYEQVVHDDHNFLMIDRKTKDKRLEYRAGLDGLLL